MSSDNGNQVRNRRSGPDHELDQFGYPPANYKHYLACPFSKHDPDRYLMVTNACTERWGFKDIGKLNEHIQRVHSLQLGCITCKARFNQAKKGQSKSKKDTVEQLKRDHVCAPREFTGADPQWMTEEQELRFANRKGQVTPHEGREKGWKRIYMCLFGTAENDLPSPYYAYLVPDHLISRSRPTIFYDSTRGLDEEIPPPTQHPAGNNYGVEMLSAPEQSYRPRLDRNTLENEGGRGDHGFEWAVRAGADSAYGSGDTQETQDAEDPFSPALLTSHEAPHLSPPHPRDTLDTVFFTTGGVPDEPEAVYYDQYLHI